MSGWEMDESELVAQALADMGWREVEPPPEPADSEVSAGDAPALGGGWYERGKAEGRQERQREIVATLDDLREHARGFAYSLSASGDVGRSDQEWAKVHVLDRAKERIEGGA